MLDVYGNFGPFLWSLSPRMLPFVVIPFVPCIPGFPKPWSINWWQVGDIHSIFPAKCNTTCTYSGNMKIMWSHHFWGLPYCLFHFDMTVLKKVRFLPGWVAKTPQQPPPPTLEISSTPNSKKNLQVWSPSDRLAGSPCHRGDPSSTQGKV